MEDSQNYAECMKHKRMYALSFLKSSKIETTRVFCFLFCWEWGANSGLHAWEAGTLLLESHLQSILLSVFWRWGLMIYLPRLAWNIDLPDLSFQAARITGMSQWHLAQL
jgi:hypothetical protein